MPRKPSSNLPIQVSTPFERLKIHRITLLGEIPQVVTFHMKSFEHNFTGTFGRLFLEFYFKCIAGSPDGVILACTDGDKIVGLVIGIASKNKIHGPRFFFFGALITLWQMVTRPRIFILILRHIKRMMTGGRNERCDAELESIAVDPGYRRRGMGLRLVEHLENFFTSKNINEYELVTDMVQGEGYKFYDRLGFSIVRRVSLFGLESRVYRKRLG